MTSLNRVMLIGRLGSDPEIQRFESGTVKAAFRLATSERYTNRDGQKVEKTDWHSIIVWGKLAEVAERFLKKGKLIFIEGRLSTRTWEDANGQKRFVVEIEANNFQMLSKDEQGGGEHSATSASGQKGGYAKQDDDLTPPNEMPKMNDGNHDDADDLPF
ncbi:MAG: single-stranded DNA-binding protein [Sphingobacteriales bacterium]|jgi:single-strand DNA-binding protein|nr:single-stranded DNA-binding protein [Sphingobacteriales bacterium]MBP9142323.1 single-stranded DNA-binding protein [Chitinophagales bacterium]MDA0199845.1 single-stranded DNA-binding protein [Bacteroidota bacterium]MBK6890605.1 single-stranded DNA-binding protein [Sphingobacteriales bacterium]MBK7526344.1 single-stranded DNA-binding protein [Sphingobacteriales bacterium]